MSPALSVKNLSCGIGRTTILRDITFALEPGQSCAIVGVNGVGKSTLLRALAGLREPLSGQVLIDGTDVRSLAPKQRARLVSYVGQEEQLSPDMRVGEALALGRLPYAKPWELHTRSSRVLVRSALEQVGLPGVHDRNVSDLSGGQRRLALLARALVQDTPVIILDEPTNHLDVNHQHMLLDVVLGANKTVVATMHDLDLALARFDHVVLLANGGIVATGAGREVLTAARLTQYFGVHGVVVTPPDCQHPHLVIDSVK
ncbi:ABC transporter ATP-binding protein [Corynebacterium epidermidicanis]|uniref:ABC-type cobalamin/Fe3+-siderophore transport system, ATPase component n=1 Tax=Corynebacterium epidermidicanis TaxID=1050174 RepID=A0A0G3GQT4_9CORY|nr:ABC transporter ATP-binding protein [Corynebacterium epidermidicanis]AKK02935.1 ABC-type cobalamin/Fe3+-siderophore transport system, ATPase component [Corynebacterium epidermidicanis]